MPMPADVGVIDLMLSIPGEDNSQWYEYMKPMLLDEESRQVLFNFMWVSRLCSPW